LGLKVAIVAYDDGDPDNDKGPLYSGIFEKSWRAMGCPSDLFAFQGVNEETSALSTTPSPSLGVESNAGTWEVRRIEATHSVKSNRAARNTTGGCYAQTA